jgi:hypothetical protein
MPDELARPARQAARTRTTRLSHHARQATAGRGNVAGTNITIRSRTDTAGGPHRHSRDDGGRGAQRPDNDRRASSADRSGRERRGHDSDDAAPRSGGNRARGGGSRRRRLVAVVVLVAVISGLWLTRDRWWHLVTPANPYETSPAGNFPIGADGIVTPPAAAVDGMTAAQVADALGRVKQALEAAYLDHRLLVDHDPSPLLNLLAPDSATTVWQRFEAGQYGTAMVQLAAGTTLAGEPRSSGQMSYQRVVWDGRPALDVTTNYVFVYAFARPSGMVVIHTETHWMFPMGADLRSSSRGMYLGRTNGYWHGMNCTLAAIGRTAPATAQDPHANPNYHDTDSLDSYFDPTRSIQVSSACR